VIILTTVLEAYTRRARLLGKTLRANEEPSRLSRDAAAFHVDRRRRAVYRRRLSTEPRSRVSAHRRTAAARHLARTGQADLRPSPALGRLYPKSDGGVTANVMPSTDALAAMPASACSR